MDHFSYQNGTLYCENVPLERIAEQVGTPVYVYSSATLERHFSVFTEAFEGLDALVCYAVKANSNQAVLSTLARLGAGADVVSEGELKRALKAGIPADRIVFSGVGKTPKEMRLALEAGIRQFNVESAPELTVLNDVAGSLGQIAAVSVRVNPDVDAKTHAKISTGKAENKFGIAWNQVGMIYDQIKQLPNVEAVGVDVHIGSQLTQLGPFREAFEKVKQLVEQLRADGHEIRDLDLGGGLGIPYDKTKEAPPAPDAYGAMVREALGDLDIGLVFEPGRLIAGNSGVLLTELVYAKSGQERTFYILDAAMNDLARPAMYDAHHDFVPVKEPGPKTEFLKADFVGPVCESGDTFAKDRDTSEMVSGDLLAIRSAGAYGAVMASTYNSRPLVPEVLVKGDQYHVIRPRQDIEALIAQDDLPPWLGVPAS